ncbi:Lysine-specific demethylase JMJ25 [Camellia lanceoleosa]|uniref:Lysine-specific demethylase JMJ25 n=1 Tax=Camellia lanceoleosa TaxID=1840588 RepID=A0ACC0HER6_9ERIC|nr:Lysine-specific demethylase JMJ25 [Camellia lanceoleosa]
MGDSSALPETEAEGAVPPEHLRCGRSDGKKWRCTGWKLQDKSDSQKHHLQSLQKSSSKKSASARVTKAAINEKPQRSGLSSKKKRKSRTDGESEDERRNREWGQIEQKVGGEGEDESSGGDSEDNEEKKKKKKVRKLQAKTIIKYSGDEEEAHDERGDSDDEKDDKIESASLGRKKKFSKLQEKKLGLLKKHKQEEEDNTDDSNLGGDDDCSMCHQCMYSTKRVVRYPQLSEEAIAESCPYCRETAIAKLTNKYTGQPKSKDERIRHLKYLIYVLYPFLKQFDHDQTMEKEMEAKIQGLSLSDIEIQQAVCCNDERIYCNNCSTSIVDFHRSCPNCSFDLCLTCCREIRGGCLQGGGNDIVVQYSDRVKSYGEKPLTSLSDKKSCSSSEETGDIPCPPEEMGGCGHDRLELKCLFLESWVSELQKKVEKLVGSQIFAHVPEISKAMLLFQFGWDLEHFQRHWVMGEPVIVRNVLEFTCGLSWEPMVMWRAFREISYNKGSSDLAVTAVDCLDWCEVSLFKIPLYLVSYGGVL